LPNANAQKKTQLIQRKGKHQENGEQVQVTVTVSEAKKDEGCSKIQP
jgi:hypothetical protein